MRRLAAFAALIVLPACSGSLGQAQHPGKLGLPPDSPECRSLSSAQGNLSGAAKVTGFLAGGSGLSVIAWQHESMQQGSAIASMVLGAATAGLIEWANAKSRDWDRACRIPAAQPPVEP